MVMPGLPSLECFLGERVESYFLVEKEFRSMSGQANAVHIQGMLNAQQYLSRSHGGSTSYTVNGFSMLFCPPPPVF